MNLLNKLISIGEKKSGTDAGIKAQNYIIDYLKKNFPGSKIEKENFPIESTFNNKASIVFKDQQIIAHLYDNTGAEGNFVKSELYHAGYRLNRKDKKNVKGKIAVFQHNVLFHRIFQIITAYESGASGVLLVSKSGEYIQKGIGHPYILGHCPIPAVGITKSDWEFIKKSRGNSLEINYSMSYENIESTNIIFDLKKENHSKNTIVIGAHYDSWYEGCQDNCIAVQLLVDILDSIKNNKENNLKSPIRAIFFDAEELSLMGSRFHVNNNDSVNNYGFYLNLEMPIPTHAGKSKFIGYSNHKVAKKSFSKIAILAKGLFSVPLKLFYTFFPVLPMDLDAFYHRDIPCITTFCRNPFIHTPLDTLENIKLDQYDKMKNILLKLIYEIDKEL